MRIIELEREIPEGINNLSKLWNVPACVYDGEIVQNFAKVLNVSSDNIVVMASEIDAERIIHIKQTGSRRDPTLKDFKKTLKEFVEKAKQNPDKKYLHI